jgi:iron complex transport system substrate-binding protein
MYNFMRTPVISPRKALILLLSWLLLLAISGCANQSASAPATDFYGTPITFPQKAPQRIVSLVTGTSEMLGALHLEHRVVGVDYYTDYPAALTSLPRVDDANGVYNIEQIVSLRPDLVLSWGGETKQYDAQLKHLGLNVVDLPTGNLSQTIQQILLVGQLTLTENTATTVVQQLQQQIDHIKATVAKTTAPSVLLEVDDSTPGKPFVFGGSSFGDEMLQDAHAVNIFHRNSSNNGYPQVSDEAVIQANPQFVLLTEDPAFGGDVNLVYQRANWSSIDALKSHHVYHINVDIMQHPGPRLVEGLQCVAQLVHPDKFPGVALPTYC